MKSGGSFQEASSNTVSTILLVAIVVILAALVAIIVMGLEIPEYHLPEEVPCLFEIHAVASDIPKYESLISLMNICGKSYENDELMCEVYINDEPSGCVIETMNGHNFISTIHLGIQHLWGHGCCNTYWNPDEKIVLDLSDSTIKNGDTIRVEIIWKPTMEVISVDEYYHHN